MHPNSLEDFQFLASPPSWYEVAKGLKEQACALQATRSALVRFTNNRGVTQTRYETNRGVFLLAGFSIENIVKAFLIYEHPSYIAGGKLGNQLRTHQLPKLWQKSGHVPYKKRYVPTIVALEDGLESWARYPCGLTHAASALEKEMTRKLWSSYLSLFSACSTRLERLLSKEWEGPDGNRFSIQYEHRT